MVILHAVLRYCRVYSRRVELKKRFRRAMSQINLNSALDPLAPLQRWVAYTQTEVLRFKQELRAANEEEQSIRTLQQRQLDSVQVQLREMDQRLSEVVDAVTELFNKQKSVHDLLGRLLQDLDALQGQTQQQNIPTLKISDTQPY